MKKIFTTTIAITALCFFAGNTFAAPAMKMADEAYEPFDPKKKKPGDECTRNDECQKHHACEKTGDKNLCTAPPRPKLPPGVVT